MKTNTTPTRKITSFAQFLEAIWVVAAMTYGRGIIICQLSTSVKYNPTLPHAEMAKSNQTWFPGRAGGGLMLGRLYCMWTLL